MKVCVAMSKCVVFSFAVLFSLSIQAQSYVVDEGEGSDQGGGKRSDYNLYSLSKANGLTLISQVELSDGGLLLACHVKGQTHLAGFLLESRGPQDLVLARLDAEGELIWFHQIGGAVKQELTWIQVHEDGSFSIAGQFEGRMQGPWEDFQSAGQNDVFLAHFNLEGGLDWAQQFTSRHSLAVQSPVIEGGSMEISLEVTKMKRHALLHLWVPTVINYEHFRFNADGELQERFNSEQP